MTQQTFDSRVNSAETRRRIEAEVATKQRAEQARALLALYAEGRKARAEKAEKAKWVTIEPPP
jgi:hypothetical protein